MPSRKKRSFYQVASKTLPDSQTVAIDIKFMLVHGFRDIYDKEWDYGASLEGWLRRIGNTVPGNHVSTSFTAHVFQFDMSSLVAGSDPEVEKTYPLAFKNQRAKLFKKTTKLQAWEIWTAPAEANKTVVLFIAHGLGVWLVKDMMLSEPRGNVIAARTLGIVALDDSISESEPLAYHTYIKGLCDTFRVTTPSMHALETLTQWLGEVDKGFKKIQGLLHIREMKWVYSSIVVWGVITTRAVNEAGTPKSKLKRKLARSFFHSGRGREIPNEKQVYECIWSAIDTHVNLQSSNGHQDPSSSITQVEGTQLSSVEDTTRPKSALSRQSVALGASNTGRAGSVLVLSPEIAEPWRKISQDWERMYKQAGEYLRKGQLESAMNLCREATKLLQRSSVGSGLLDLNRLRIELQMDIITLLRGRYEDLSEATARLQMLKHEFKGQTSEKNQIGRWLAESFTLQGDHWSAARELGEALDKHYQTMKGGRKPILTDSLEDISLVRDIALTFAHLGFFTRAQRVINFLLKSLDDKLGDLRKNLDKLQALLVRKDSGESFSEYWKKEANDCARKESELSSKRDSVAFAAAIIQMLVGNYEQALRLAQEAWRGISSQYSPTNIKALDCSRLIAHLLALTSRNQEAEGVCSSTLKTLSTELGPRHPHTLGTMRTLVFLHRTHYRLDQAVATAKTLSDITASVMARAHPQAVEARAELASSLRFAGDYRAALQVYLDIVSESQMSYARTMDDHGFVHPDALRYRSELAHVYVDMGQLNQAETLVLDVLLEQQHTYRVELSQADEGELELSLTKQTKDKYPSQSRQTIVRALLGILELEYFLDEVRGILPPGDTGQNLSAQELQEYNRLEDVFAKRLEKIGGDIQQYQDLKHRRRMLQVHPSLLHALEIWAKISFAPLDENTDVDPICSILEVILRWRKKTLGSFHDLALKSQYQLALAKSQSALPKERKEARDLFRTVFIRRSSRLGSTHPDTLSAKREFVITCASLEQWENPDEIPISTNSAAVVMSPSINTEASEHAVTVNIHGEQDSEMTQEEWEAMELCSREIIIDQRTKPGPAHPETIKSLLWLFTLQSGLCKIAAASRTMKTLLQRLRRTRVQEQRLMSSLMIEERIAGICLDQNQTADALDILSNIVQRCKLEDQKIRSQSRNIDSLRDIDGFSQDLATSPEFQSLQVRCKTHTDTLQGSLEAFVRASFKLYRSISDGGGRKADANVYLINSFRLARADSEWNLRLERALPHSLKREMCEWLEEDVKSCLLAPDTQPFEKRLEAACSLLEAIFPKNLVQRVRAEALLLSVSSKTDSVLDTRNGTTDHRTVTQHGDTVGHSVNEDVNGDSPPETRSPVPLDKIMEGFGLLIFGQMGCNDMSSEEAVEDHISESSGVSGQFGS